LANAKEPEGLKRPETHLVVCSHGLHGTGADFSFIKEVLGNTSDKLQIHAALCNDGFLKTHEGVEVGGKKLAEEILKIVEKDPSIKKFSMIGHSLGGIYSRYCLGILHENGFFEKYEPINFITLASPHMGSRRPMKGFFNPLAALVTKFAFSRTGRQLMLEDKDEEFPLLYRMSSKESHFFKALSLFKKRVLYANIDNDIQVPYCTAAIVPRNPYKKNNGNVEFSLSVEFPHMVESSLSSESGESVMEELAFENDHMKEQLRYMMQNLRSLEWERFDVYFSNFLSHEKIVTKRPWMADNGQDIAMHLTRFFKQ